ncbi:MAG: hypothetical protein AB7I48_12545 [Planctomycetaceae bacterium]
MEPLQNVATSLRAHRDLLLNWFRAKGVSSAGVVEGLQGKAKRTMKKRWLPHLRNTASRARPHPWQTSRTRLYPQLPVRRLRGQNKNPNDLNAFPGKALNVEVVLGALNRNVGASGSGQADVGTSCSSFPGS